MKVDELELLLHKGDYFKLNEISWRKNEQFAGGITAVTIQKPHNLEMGTISQINGDQVTIFAPFHGSELYNPETMITYGIQEAHIPRTMLKMDFGILSCEFTKATNYYFLMNYEKYLSDIRTEFRQVAVAFRQCEKNNVTIDKANIDLIMKNTCHRNDIKALTTKNDIHLTELNHFRVSEARYREENEQLKQQMLR
jgi:hypothetical protein